MKALVSEADCVSCFCVVTWSSDSWWISEWNLLSLTFHSMVHCCHFNVSQINPHGLSGDIVTPAHPQCGSDHIHWLVICWAIVSKLCVSAANDDDDDVFRYFCYIAW